MDNLQSEKNITLQRGTAVSQPSPFSRRDLLRWAGRGALGLSALTLLGSDTALARQGLSGLGQPLHGLSVSTSFPTLQLPLWGDGAKWNEPQYYETIRTGDIDGDGQDELIIRGSSGIQVHHFDPVSGQWIPMSNGPALSDASKWNFAWAYTSIQLADINGDGQAEIVASSATGLIQAWKYDNDMASSTYQQWRNLPDGPTVEPLLFIPLYLATMRWGDIDGDGKEELFIRLSDGGHIFQFQPDTSDPVKVTGTWVSLTPTPSPSTWTDNYDGTNIWQLPQHYETIQLADVNHDGKTELLARGPQGLQTWHWLSHFGWYTIPQSGLNILADAFWEEPQYYETIQCADVDGDGSKELLARGPVGILLWHYNKSSNAWVFVDAPGTEDINDNQGWTLPQYYTTIHFADVDGDGKDELLARGWQGIVVWKFGNNAWTRMPNGPNWADNGTDTNGKPVPDSNGTKWDQVEYYSTIRYAKVYGDNRGQDLTHYPPVHPNANNPATGSKTVAALLGRDQYALQTWRYISTSQVFVRAAAPYPQYVSDGVSGSDAAQQATAYKYLSQKAESVDDIRTKYAGLDNSGATNDRTDIGMYSSPGGVSPANWSIVQNQVSFELEQVANLDSFLTQCQTYLGSSVFPISNAILDAVNAKVSADEAPSGSVALTILDTVLNAAWAMSAVVGVLTADPVLIAAAAVATGLSASGATLLNLTTDVGTPTNETYASLKTKLSNSNQTWNSYFEISDTNPTPPFQTAITANWGLTQVLGPIGKGYVANSDVQAAANNAFELWCWQQLTPLSWRVDIYDSGFHVPSGIPNQYTALLPYSTTTARYLIAKQLAFEIFPKSPDVSHLDRLFKTPTVGLGVPLNEVLLGTNGWSLPVFNEGVGSSIGPLPKPASNVNIRIHLERNAQTGHIEAQITATNDLDHAITNVEVTSATLGSAKSSNAFPLHRKRLAKYKPYTFTLPFPGNVGAAGKTVILRLQGKYKNGTFGGSFRVNLP